MFMSRMTARKLKAICNYITGWILVTVGATALGMLAFAEFNIDSLFFMLQLSIFVGLSHGIYDVVVLQDEMDHRSVTAALLIRSLYFITNISINYALCILVWNMDKERTGSSQCRDSNKSSRRSKRTNASPRSR